MKPQPGVTPLAPLLSPLSPGVDVKQEVEAKNGIRNAMEQDNEEEDGEVHEEEEDEAQPYCQPRHRPFPPIEEFDRKYMAKLQVKRIISFSSLLGLILIFTLFSRQSMLRSMTLIRDKSSSTV